MATVSAKQFFGGGNVSVVGNHSEEIAQKQPGLISKAATGLGHFAQTVGHDYMDSAKTIVHNTSDVISGNKSAKDALLQNAGEVAKATVAPISEAVKPVVNKAADVLSHNQAFEAIANSKAGDVVAGSVNHATQAYSDWAKKHPEASKNLEASVNIAGLLAAPEAEGAATDSLGNATKSVLKGATGKVAEATSGARDSLAGATDIATQVRNKLSDAATPMEDSVVTEINKLSKPDKFKHYFSQAEQAMKDNSQPTPMEMAGGFAEHALKTIDTKLKEVGQTKKAATEAVGKNGAGTIVKDALNNLHQGLQDRFGGVFDKSGDIISAKGRSLTISDTEKPLINSVKSKLDSISKFPTVRRVDDAVDFIQKELYKSNKNLALPANKELNGFLKEVTGVLNNGLKKVAGADYSTANSEFSRLKYLRDNLNVALGQDANKGASLMKQLFSPTGTASKKMFELIKKETGVDLVNEATLAKYAMESVGDVRQASLLQQAIESPQQLISKSGIVNKAVDTVVNKLKDPVGKAKRIIEKNKKLGEKK